MNVEKLYNDCERIILSAAYRHARAHGGELDELIQEARCAFLEAAKTWNPRKGKLKSWVYLTVRHKLAELSRSEYRRGGIASREEGINTNIPDPRSLSPFDLTEFLDELTNDARAIVRVVLDVPEFDLSVSARQILPNKIVLWKHLEKCGWVASRIRSAFHEIETVLAGRKSPVPRTAW